MLEGFGKERDEQQRKKSNFLPGAGAVSEGVFWGVLFCFLGGCLLSCIRLSEGRREGEIEEKLRGGVLAVLGMENFTAAAGPGDPAPQNLELAGLFPGRGSPEQGQTRSSE